MPTREDTQNVCDIHPPWEYEQVCGEQPGQAVQPIQISATVEYKCDSRLVYEWALQSVLPVDMQAHVHTGTHRHRHEHNIVQYQIHCQSDPRVACLQRQECIQADHGQHPTMQATHQMVQWHPQCWPVSLFCHCLILN